MRIGKHQTRTLMLVASPFNMLVTENGVSRSLLQRGLLRRYGRAGTQITADGLRSLADAMDRGVVDDVREQIKRERAERKKGAAR